MDVAKIHARLVADLRVTTDQRTRVTRLSKDLAYARSVAFAQALEDLTGITADAWLRMSAVLADDEEE